MKKRLTGYTFTAAAKTVVHADFSDITLAGIQLIVNVTDQIIIYNFADTSKGGTLATDTLTLEYDTTTMSDTDELMILVEDGVATVGVTSATLATAANQSTVIGHLDGVETLLGTIDADTGNIATSVANIDTDTTTIIGHLDGVEGLLTTIDGDTGSLAELVKAEDAVHSSGDKGVMMLGVVNAGFTTLAAEGDYAPIQVDQYGRQFAVVDVGTLPGTTEADIEEIRVDADAIRVAVETLDNAIAGTEMQVDVVGALPAGTNAIGKLAANSGVDIGDVDVTTVVPGTGATNLGKAEDAAHTTGDTGVFALGVRVDSPNVALTNTDADYSPIATNKLGSIRTAIPEDDLATAATTHVKKYYTNSGAVTDGIIWSPAAGKRWFVTDIIINTSAAATVTLEDDLAAGDSAVMKFELAANSGVTHSFKTPLYSGEDAADLLVTTSAGNIYITVTGYEI